MFPIQVLQGEAFLFYYCEKNSSRFPVRMAEPRRVTQDGTMLEISKIYSSQRIGCPTQGLE